MSILQVTDIRKFYGGIRALDGCSMTFEEGAINGLIGPNGSGKTTLFNVISGYETADAGQVTLRGKDITNSTPDRVFELGLGRTFQVTRIFPRLTVMENLHVASQRRGFFGQLRSWKSADERARANEVLDFVGLSRLADEPAGGLSWSSRSS
jgi:neutral amino acid transport system ATP-binding protein